jgi:hypothetical protein
MLSVGILWLWMTWKILEFSQHYSCRSGGLWELPVTHCGYNTISSAGSLQRPGFRWASLVTEGFHWHVPASGDIIGVEFWLTWKAGRGLDASSSASSFNILCEVYKLFKLVVLMLALSCWCVSHVLYLLRCYFILSVSLSFAWAALSRLIFLSFIDYI